MFYYLFEYLEKEFQLPGAGLFQFISFRASIAIIFSLLVSLIFGKRIIQLLNRFQMGESIRDLGLAGQKEKAGTPTMGGLIIILATLVPVFLFAKLDNIYILLLIITTLWMGSIGFIDDYIKIKRKNKEGLKGRFKIIGQVGLGLIVGITLISTDVTIRENATIGQEVVINEKSTKTTIPLLKNNEFDMLM